MIAALLRRRRVLAGPLAVVAVAVVVGSVLFMAGGAAHGQTGQSLLVSTNSSDILAGQTLYDTHCESCHGYEGKGGVTSAPALVSVGAAAADFYLTTGRMPLNNPANQALRHHPYFDRTQIRQLDAYIAALPGITGDGPPGPAIPTVAPLCSSPSGSGGSGGSGNRSGSGSGCVTLSEGESGFALNCAECHQAAGSGGMLSKGNVIPTLRNANITQVAEAMRVGPKPMPVFGPKEISNKEMSAIAHYVEYLHQPASPGGLRISGFGPIAEGFVGIVFGFGILLFAVRMIGTRG